MRKTSISLKILALVLGLIILGTKKIKEKTSMRKASKILKALSLVLGLIILGGPAGAAEITGGYPGHPNTWEGLTSNTIIEIELDAPVAMVAGRQSSHASLTALASRSGSSRK